LGWSFVSRQQTQNLLSQPLSITYFMKEFTKKEPISEWVRWNAGQIRLDNPIQTSFFLS
jgi:hypothetical protein